MYATFTQTLRAARADADAGRRRRPQPRRAGARHGRRSCASPTAVAGRRGREHGARRRLAVPRPRPPHRARAGGGRRGGVRARPAAAAHRGRAAAGAGAVRLRDHLSQPLPERAAARAGARPRAGRPGQSARPRLPARRRCTRCSTNSPARPARELLAGAAAGLLAEVETLVDGVLAAPDQAAAAAALPARLHEIAAEVAALSDRITRRYFALLPAVQTRGRQRDAAEMRGAACGAGMKYRVRHVTTYGYAQAGRSRRATCCIWRRATCRTSRCSNAPSPVEPTPVARRARARTISATASPGCSWTCRTQRSRSRCDAAGRGGVPRTARAADTPPWEEVAAAAARRRRRRLAGGGVRLRQPDGRRPMPAAGAYAAQSFTARPAGPGRRCST